MSAVRHYYIIYGNSKLDGFMHHFDLFESWKRLISPVEKIEASYKPKARPKIAKFLAAMKEVYSQKGHFVLAVWCVESPVGAWRDQTVKMVSTGYQFCMFKELLLNAGFPKEKL